MLVLMSVNQTSAPAFQLFSRSPLAADRRNNSAFSLELLHCCINFLAVETAQFSNLTCVERLTCLLHCCQYFFFCFHNELCLIVEI